jgi:CheY-like chemotaxis protein
MRIYPLVLSTFAYTTPSRLFIYIVLTTLYFIDDDVDDQQLFQYAVTAVDPTIDCIIESSGPDALHRLQHDDSFIPSFIFLDLNLPRLDGKTVLSEIKKIGRIRHIPVIIYSTSNYPGDIKACEELGAAGYITKPSGYLEMVDILRATLTSLFHNSNFFVVTA